MKVLSVEERANYCLTSSSDSTQRRVPQFESTRRLKGTVTEEGTANRQLFLAQDSRIENNKHYEASASSNGNFINAKGYIHGLEEHILNKCLCYTERRHIPKLANHCNIEQGVIVVKGKVARSYELLRSRIRLYFGIDMYQQSYFLRTTTLFT